MVKKVLKNINLESGSLSYINCLYSILENAGLFSGPKFLLAGMTGMSFKFSVVKGISPISINSYGPWARDHWTAVNHLGILNSAKADRCRHRTFTLYQKKAMEEIVASIDNGIAVMYWGPPFSVIYGYNLEERIFYYLESDDFFRQGRKSFLQGKVSLFENFGINRSQFWFYQTFGGKIHKPQQAIILDSLKGANIDWNKPASMDIAYGKEAYSLLLQSLDSGDFHPVGAALTLDSYATSKADISQYMNEVVKVFPILTLARDQFLWVSEIFQQIKYRIGFVDKYSTLKLESCSPLAKLIQEAWHYEEIAMQEIKEFIEQQAPPSPSDWIRAGWLHGDAR